MQNFKFMRTLNNIKAIVILVCIFFSTTSCRKQDEWLDVKRNKSDVVPQVLADFQAILDNNRDLQSLTLAGAASADNFYFSEANYLTAAEVDRNLYIWNSQIWVNGSSIDWTYSYRNIAYANIVLDGMEKLPTNQPGFKNVKGQALFWRAFTFNYLTQLFCKPYNPQTSNIDLGIPLRTSSDINIIYQRATLQETYNKIILDLKEAIDLLDETAPFTTRPNKIAAIAMLSKVYFIMGNYEQSFAFADKVLTMKKSLLDFNSNLVNISLTYRFPDFNGGNPEMIFYLQGGGYDGPLVATAQKGFVSPTLYASYDNNDLRKTVFYLNSGDNNQVRARGTYTGRNSNFTGIALNEILLIRAECFARNGKAVEAIDDLNLLLKNRFKIGTFSPLQAINADQALLMILNERRKELPFTGNLRWEDLRRLNMESRFALTLSRTINGKTYSLVSNDPRYTLPIPQTEIDLSGLKQNIR